MHSAKIFQYDTLTSKGILCHTGRTMALVETERAVSKQRAILRKTPIVLAYSGCLPWRLVELIWPRRRTGSAMAAAIV